MQRSVNRSCKGPASRLRQLSRETVRPTAGTPKNSRRTRKWSTRCACRSTPTSTNLILACEFPISVGGEQCGLVPKRAGFEILRRGDAAGTHLTLECLILASWVAKRCCGLATACLGLHDFEDRAEVRRLSPS